MAGLLDKITQNAILIKMDDYNNPIKFSRNWWKKKVSKQTLKYLM